MLSTFRRLLRPRIFRPRIVYRPWILYRPRCMEHIIPAKSVSWVLKVETETVSIGQNHCYNKRYLPRGKPCWLADQIRAWGHRLSHDPHILLSIVSRAYVVAHYFDCSKIKMLWLILPLKLQIIKKDWKTTIWRIMGHCFTCCSHLQYWKSSLIWCRFQVFFSRIRGVAIACHC